MMSSKDGAMGMPGIRYHGMSVGLAFGYMVACKRIGATKHCSYEIDALIHYLNFVSDFVNK